MHKLCTGDAVKWRPAYWHYWPAYFKGCAPTTLLWLVHLHRFLAIEIYGTHPWLCCLSVCSWGFIPYGMGLCSQVGCPLWCLTQFIIQTTGMFTIKRSLLRPDAGPSPLWGTCQIPKMTHMNIFQFWIPFNSLVWRVNTIFLNQYDAKTFSWGFYSPSDTCECPIRNWKVASTWQAHALLENLTKSLVLLLELLSKTRSRQWKNIALIVYEQYKATESLQSAKWGYMKFTCHLKPISVFYFRNFTRPSDEVSSRQLRGPGNKANLFSKKSMKLANGSVLRFEEILSRHHSLIGHGTCVSRASLINPPAGRNPVVVVKISSPTSSRRSETAILENSRCKVIGEHTGSYPI